MRKKIMLIVPMLHQGGFERICIMTARLLEKEHDVTVVVFSLEDLAFDISGLTVIDLGLEAKSGKLGKILNVLKRGRKLTALQKKLGIEVSYSFGMTANIANALSFGAKKKITACHSFEEIKKKGYMKLISRHSDKVLCCAKKMADMVVETYGFQNIVPLWNPCDIDGIIKQSKETQKEDLSFFEIAESYRNLIRNQGMTQTEVAKKVGKSQSSVANKLRLLNLSPLVKKLIRDYNLSERHARALLALKSEDEQVEVIRTICREHLNVSQTEELIKIMTNNRGLNDKRIKVATVKDIKVFKNTISQAMDIMKRGGVEAHMVENAFDWGTEYVIKIKK